MEASFKVFEERDYDDYFVDYCCVVSDVETEEELFRVTGDSRQWVIGQARMKLRELKRAQEPKPPFSITVEDPTPLVVGALGLAGLIAGIVYFFKNGKKDTKPAPLIAPQPFDADQWLKNIEEQAEKDKQRKHQEILDSLPDDNHRRTFEQLCPGYERTLNEAMKRGEALVQSLPRVSIRG